MDLLLFGKKIIVAEDSFALATVYQKYLEDEGAEVYLAEDGDEGLNLCFLHKPDLIIADISMPRLGGLEMVSSLKNVEELKNIPVLIITGSMMKLHIIEASKLGVEEYLVKPVSYKNMFEKVKKILKV